MKQEKKKRPETEKNKYVGINDENIEEPAVEKEPTKTEKINYNLRLDKKPAHLAS